MVKTALHILTKRPGDGCSPGNCGSSIKSDLPLPSEFRRRTATEQPFDVGSFDLLRKFVEHIVDRNASGALENNQSPFTIDWETIEASVADSCSFQQAVGRAVVIADQMSRGMSGDIEFGDAPPDAEATFFPFSVADVVPDFGDESRYRTRVARKMGKIFAARRAVVALVISFMLVPFCAALYLVARPAPAASTSSATPADRVVTKAAQHQNGATSDVAPLQIPAVNPPGAALSLADTTPLRSREVFELTPHRGFQRNTDST